MSKKFVICIDAMVKIRDVGKSGTRGYTFVVSDEEYEKSKEIRAFLKAGWLKEITENTISEEKTKTIDEKITDNNVKLRRDEKEDVINKLKDLKIFKSNYPGVIDEKCKITDQIAKYDSFIEDDTVNKLDELKKFKEKHPKEIDETLTLLEQIKVYEYNKQSQKQDDDSFAKKHRVIEMNEDTPIGTKLKKPSIKKVVEKLKESKEKVKETKEIIEEKAKEIKEKVKEALNEISDLTDTDLLVNTEEKPIENKKEKKPRKERKVKAEKKKKENEDELIDSIFDT